jgi:hypothetical protein
MLFGLALIFTISLSLALGIFAGYLTVCLLLRLMSLRSSQHVPVTAIPETQPVAVSGD